MNIPEKIILNNPLNWILSWNEWITQFFNRYLPFLMISPLFCLFWTLFGQFLGTFPIRPIWIIPWLLNWIIFWIESSEFILNWIMIWIELNHFLAIVWHFFYLASFIDSLTIELNYLLNWISRFFLNWIIFWIESWVKQYWIEYWMNHFLAKFKHWIESDWVSATTT